MAADRVILHGKHTGKTFDDVIANDVSYLSWLTFQREQGLLDNPVFVALLNEAEAAGVAIPPYEVAIALPPNGDQVITKGKYRGKTFHEMCEHHGDYILWLNERLRKGEPTTREFRQLADYAFAMSKEHRSPRSRALRLAGAEQTEQTVLRVSS